MESAELSISDAVTLGLKRFKEFMQAAGSMPDEVRVRGMRRNPGGVLQFTISSTEKKPLPPMDAQRLAIKRALGTQIDDEGNLLETKRFSVEIDSSGSLILVDELPERDA